MFGKFVPASEEVIKLSEAETEASRVLDEAGKNYNRKREIYNANPCDKTNADVEQAWIEFQEAGDRYDEAYDKLRGAVEKEIKS